MGKGEVATEIPKCLRDFLHESLCHNDSLTSQLVFVSLDFAFHYPLEILPASLTLSALSNCVPIIMATTHTRGPAIVSQLPFRLPVPQLDNLLHSLRPERPRRVIDALPTQPVRSSFNQCHLYVRRARSRFVGVGTDGDGASVAWLERPGEG